MVVEFHDSDLEKLAFDPAYTAKWSPILTRSFRKRINQIKQAPNRQVLYAFKALRLEKLKGKMKNKHSIRINDQFRLIFQFVKQGGEEKVVIFKIEDYH